MSFGWKAKVRYLQTVLLSGGHQLAKDLPPGFAQLLALFRAAAKSGDGSRLVEEMARLDRDFPDEPKPLWELVEICGWKIGATFYLEHGQLWWLLHAVRSDEQEPRAKDIAFLDKVLELLGADPKRDLIIGPRSSPAGESALPFAWYTWFNHSPLSEIQTKGWKHTAKVRIVPLGSPETDGYRALDKLDKKEPDA